MSLRLIGIGSISFVLLSLGFFFLFTSVFAQTGTPCHGYQSGQTPPDGYGAAWNVLRTGNPLLLTTTCQGTSATLSVGHGADETNHYVYKQGYIYSGAWQPYTLSGTFVQGSVDWLQGRGTYILNNTPNGTTYWVGYVCQWSSGEWNCGCRDSACATNYWQLQTFTMPQAGGSTGGTTGGSGAQANVYQCADGFSGPKYTKQFAWKGTCTGLNQHSGCYYFDYNGVDVPNQARFDQRGVFGYQVTFPRVVDLWMALRLNEGANEKICYAGGAHVGRNPLAMTWSGPPGGKSRKNNFLGMWNGALEVEGVRAHDIHDPIYPYGQGGLHLRHSWFSWNRDDIIEGDLTKVRISDTLMDGTYGFLSSPDSRTNKDYSNNTLVIENSLIRLQRMPGPHGDPGTKWHWSVEGGHGQLWKISPCGWSKWPKFELRNNIFLIEGPPSTKFALHDATEAGMALPSADGSNLPNLTKCENNLFLYADYDKYQGSAPGAIPKSGGKFFNSSNPNYKRNGSDCYQRVTDKPGDPGFGDPMGIWRQEREKWIARHTGSSNAKKNVMTIPGVDFSVLNVGQSYQLRNKSTGQCVQHGGSGADVSLSTCNGSAAQLWVAEPRTDGKLRGAILLRNKSSGGYLRTQDESAIAGDGNDNQFDSDVLWVSNSAPNFKERWYIVPLGGEPGGTANTYAIESDALRRSFILANGSKLQVQLFYTNGENTPLPQNTAGFINGNDNHARMQWYVEPR